MCQVLSVPGQSWNFGKSDTQNVLETPIDSREIERQILETQDGAGKIQPPLQNPENRNKTREEATRKKHGTGEKREL